MEAEVSISKEKSKPNPTNNLQTSPTIPSLEAFMANFFFNSVIQDDPAVVKLTIDTNMSRNLVERTRNSKQDVSLAIALHDTFSNLDFLSQSFVVSPRDPEGKVGKIANLFSLRVIENGTTAIVDVIEISKVVFTSQGKRLIEQVNNVFVARPIGTAPPPTLAEMQLRSFFGIAFFGP